jgi:hypothetical protein
MNPRALLGGGGVRHSGHRVRFEHASPPDTAVGGLPSPVLANLPTLEVLSTQSIWNASSSDMATPKLRSADSWPPVYPDPRLGPVPEPGQVLTMGTPHSHNTVLGNHEYPTVQVQAPGTVPLKGTPYLQPTNMVYQESPAGQSQAPWPVPATGTPHLQTTMAVYRESLAGRLHTPSPIPSTGVSYLKPNKQAHQVLLAGQLSVPQPFPFMGTPCLQYTAPVYQESPPGPLQAPGVVPTSGISHSRNPVQIYESRTLGFCQTAVPVQEPPMAPMQSHEYAASDVARATVRPLMSQAYIYEPVHQAPREASGEPRASSLVTTPGPEYGGQWGPQATPSQVYGALSKPSLTHRPAEYGGQWGPQRPPTRDMVDPNSQ